MKDSTHYDMSSDNVAATERLGEKLGKRLKGGEIIELISDLGGGKTTFVRGLARGIGSTDHVASPTFTIGKVYRAPQLTIYHYDFYRLSEAGHIEHELYEALQDSRGVVVIEWAEAVHHILTNAHIVVSIKQIAEKKRHLTFNFPLTFQDNSRK